MSLAPAPGEPGSAPQEATVRATVVQAQRPTSAHPGDSAVVHADGRIEGFVGGQCAEATVRAHALRLMATGEPLLLRILPGQGALPPDLDGTATVRNTCLSGGALQIFLEPQLPPRRLTVFGTSPTAMAVADLARHQGYEVRLAPDGDTEPLPRSEAVVISSHGHFDESALRRALDAEAGYVGLVASRRRGEVLLGGLDPAERLRVHTPAGLDIGAHTPGEIAISILAEIISLRGKGQVHETTPASTPGADAATTLDPVCGMTVVAAPPTLYLEGKEGRLWFCAEACLRSYRDSALPAGSDERRPD